MAMARERSADQNTLRDFEHEPMRRETGLKQHPMNEPRQVAVAKLDR